MKYCSCQKMQKIEGSQILYVNYSPNIIHEDGTGSQSKLNYARIRAQIVDKA